jgi:hypothetical protein
MAKIHCYSLSNMRTSVSYFNEIYNEKELRNLLFEANNNLDEDIDEDIDENIDKNIDKDNFDQNVERLENINDDEQLEENLIIEKSVDLSPWVIIEVGQLPNITVTIHSNSSDDDDDDDFDPKELAKEINKNRLNIEDDEYIIDEEY